MKFGMVRSILNKFATMHCVCFHVTYIVFLCEHVKLKVATVDDSLGTLCSYVGAETERRREGL